MAKPDAGYSSEELDRMLTRLKLTAVRGQLETLLDEAARAKMTLRDALAFLCGHEIARKERAVVRHRSEDDGERRVDIGFGLAKFSYVRDLASFDFAAQPSVDRDQNRDLATGRFIANGDALLLLGPPGVGKTHLAMALGREAIVAGYSGLFTGAIELVANLVKGHAEGRLEERLSHFAKPKLLIVDELGYLRLNPALPSVFPARLALLREGRDARHLEQSRRRAGLSVRRCRGGHRDPRPAAPPLPRRHHSQR